MYGSTWLACLYVYVPEDIIGLIYSTLSYTHARRIRLLLRRGRGGVFCVRASTKGWVLGTTRDPRYFKSWSEGTVWSARALKTLSPPGIEPGAGELVASMLTTAPIDWLLVLFFPLPGLVLPTPAIRDSHSLRRNKEWKEIRLRGEYQLPTMLSIFHRIDNGRGDITRQNQGVIELLLGKTYLGY